MQETCVWEQCPGYDSEEEPLDNADDGPWHFFCHGAWMDEQAGAWLAAHAPAVARRPLHVSEVIGDVFESADNLRAARRVS